MKIILSIDNKQIKVSDQDYSLLSKYKWVISDYGYARCKDGYMHKMLFDNPQEIVDHINRDKLDNQKENLRLVNHSLNRINSKLQNNKSGYRGVYWRPERSKWIARIHLGKKYIYIGTFNNLQDAANAWNNKAKELYGEYVFQNKVVS